MIEALVRNPRLLMILTALLAVLGYTSFQTLPRLEDPRLPNRVGVVLTPYPGASAARVEALVTERIENTLQQLPELKKLTSESRDGLSVVIMELADEVYEPENEAVWARARDYLSEVRAELPAGTLPSRLDDRSAHTFTVLVGLAWNGPGEPRLATLGRYARELESRLWSVADTEYIEIAGRPREEILVSVDAARAAAIGLDFARLGQLVGEADAKLATGQLSGAAMEATVELAGEFDSLARIRNVPVTTLPDGRQLRLGDIATVERALQDPPPDLALVDGATGVVVGARMGTRRNIAAWSADARAVVEALQRELPANVRLEVLFDQNEYTAQRMDTLAQNLVTGLLLVVLVLPLCMGWRAAVIVAASLPLMTGFTLICMRAAGMQLNQMSTMGIILALGIMVDNAIVMADVVSTERRAGHGAAEAARRAVRHLRMPLLGSTLTTVLGFMPAVLMAGPAAEFPAAVAKAVVFSLTGSLLIALSVVAAAVAMTARNSAAPGVSWLESGLQLPRLTARFRASLAAALARPRRAIALTLVLPLLGLLGLSSLDERFFPPADRNLVNIEVFLPESASLEATRTLVARIDARLRPREDVERLHWFLGRSVPAHWYSLLRRHDGQQNFAQAMLRVRDTDTMRALVPALQQELDTAFPEAQVMVRALIQGPPYNAPVELRVTGPSLEVLRAKGEELRLLALGLPEVMHVRSTLGEAIPRAVVRLPEEAVRQSGLTLAEASRQLTAALGGIEQGSITEASEDVPVRVRVEASARRGVPDLATLQFVLGTRPAAGSHAGIPLDALGDVELVPGRAAIPRRNATRENAIEVYTREGELAAPVLQRLLGTLEANGFSLPPGYRLETGGEDEQQRWANELLTEHVPELLVLLCAVLVLSFRSFRLGALILGIGVMAILLGLLVIELARIPFGFVIVFALMALMGLAINAGIVVLAELRADPVCVTGDPASVIEATLRCGRHVTAATATTVLGLAPLVASDNPFFGNIALPIAGGTLLATISSMYLVPVAFLLLARRGAFAPPAEEPRAVTA